MQTKKVVGAIAVYKIIMNLLRIFLGIIIISLGSNMQRAIEFLSKYDLVEKNFILIFFSNHIRDTPCNLNMLLALILIIFSIFEIVFIFMMIYKIRIGAIGLFITTIVWMLTELLFVSRFLIAKEMMIIVVNLMIIYLLYHVIKSKDDYFKD